MKKIFPDLECGICGVLSFLMVCALFWAITGDTHAQKKPNYTLNENQTLRLKVQQLNFSIANEHYQQAIASFNAEVKAVEKENDWPETLQFHPDSLTFNEAPGTLPPAAPAHDTIPGKAPDTNPPAAKQAPAIDHGKPPKTPGPDGH